ncbi:MAG: hypothetical protein QXW56_05955 [Nitrososphaerota archaeon]
MSLSKAAALFSVALLLVGFAAGIRITGGPRTLTLTQEEWRTIEVTLTKSRTETLTKTVTWTNTLTQKETVHRTIFRTFETTTLSVVTERSVTSRAWPDPWRPKPSEGIPWHEGATLLRSCLGVGRIGYERMWNASVFGEYSISTAYGDPYPPEGQEDWLAIGLEESDACVNDAPHMYLTLVIRVLFVVEDHIQIDEWRMRAIVKDQRTGTVTEVKPAAYAIINYFSDQWSWLESFRYSMYADADLLKRVNPTGIYPDPRIPEAAKENYFPFAALYPRFSTGARVGIFIAVLWDWRNVPIEGYEFRVRIPYIPLSSITVARITPSYAGTQVVTRG